MNHEYDGSKDAPRVGLTMEDIDGRHSRDVTEPPVRTAAILTDEVEKALRSIPIARVQMRDLRMKPKYAIEYGAGLLSAEVTVKFSMLFG